MTEAQGTRPPRFGLRRIVAAFALPEFCLLSLYLLIFVGLTLVPRDDRLNLHLALIGIFAVIYAGGAYLLRARPPDRWRHYRRIPRRFLTLAAIFGVYFQLRWIIPALHPGDFDSVFHGIDKAVFGAPLAALLQPYQTAFWVEWFSFFYWTYFYILGAYVVLHIVFDKDDSHFAVLGTGVVLLHILGWSGYIAVPGFGPYDYLHSQLLPLPGGMFMRMSSTAYRWGALRDIFPSLHTAVMTWMALHAFHNWRVHRVYRIIAFPLAFWALQIIVATVYCRWHYLVDVVAGFLLATAVTFAVGPLVRRWGKFRSAAGELDPWF